MALAPAAARPLAKVDPLKPLTRAIRSLARSVKSAPAIQRRFIDLNAMSDDALAEKGLKREDLVSHVFTFRG
ncbi:MAG: hypothetical protein ACU0BB_09375 [Paracoccaceae bacterium]|jgi:uncharacterized protein YjiS (DUF1127 family)